MKRIGRAEYLRILDEQRWGGNKDYVTWVRFPSGHIRFYLMDDEVDA